MKRREAKLQNYAQRLRQRHPPSASLSGWEEREGGAGEGGAGREGGGREGRGGGGKGGGGKGGRGDVMPKRLMSGSGHHRL